MSDTRRSPPALEVRGLDVYYGHSHALQGVDLTLDSGVFSVVGRNGMGKTTLCKTIMGLLRASGGSVRVRGEDITRLSPARIAQARRRLCAAGPTAVALAQRRRAFAPGRRHAARRLDDRSHLRNVSRALPNARTMAAASSPAASSRCWRSPARFSPIRSCSSWTSRPRGSRRSSSPRSRKCWCVSARTATCRCS